MPPSRHKNPQNQKLMNKCEKKPNEMKLEKFENKNSGNLSENVGNKFNLPDESPGTFEDEIS